MDVKGFVEGGIASIVAGCSTHPLDLIKVRMQLQGESPPIANPHLRPAFAGTASVTMPHPTSPLPRSGLVSVEDFECGLLSLATSDGVGQLYYGLMVPVGVFGWCSLFAFHSSNLLIAYNWSGLCVTAG
ncbi:hypothetical protein R6Q59_035022 [Mikania micrantha]